MTADDWIKYRADDASTWPTQRVDYLTHSKRRTIVLLWEGVAWSAFNDEVTDYQPIVPPKKRLPSERAMKLAAQAWCAPETSRLVFDETLAKEFARILDRDFQWEPAVPPKKRRWMPEVGELCWYVEGTLEGFRPSRNSWGGEVFGEARRNMLGVYRTEAEAQRMIDALNACVTEIAGCV